MKRNYLILSIFLAHLIFGQNYWPTRTGKQLTSNFGEFRHNHFHMGLDIRTHSSVGHPMYAVSDGYIYRIATSFGGYGKALYLKTADGNIALYGHLQSYTNQLEKRLYDLQDEKSSYAINQYFTPEEYPVRRGEIIGYSGNSGGSMGPHLHFEYRNNVDQPLNPATSGFQLNDNIPPIFKELALIPLEPVTTIDGLSTSQNYNLLQISPNEYILSDTVSVNGKFGIAALVLDKIQNTSYSYQVERIELLVDSISNFSIHYKLLDFSEGKFISSVYGQPYNHPKGDDFQKLYRLESYPKLSIHVDDKTGILDVPTGIHEIEIFIWDAVQNQSKLSFVVNSVPLPPVTKGSSLLKLNNYPEYISKSDYYKPELIPFERGALFRLETEIDDSTTVQAFIEKEDALLTFPLTTVENNIFISELLKFSLFMDFESCGFLFYSDSIQKYEFDIIPTLILPNFTNTILSNDSLFVIKTADSFYDSTLLWTRKHSNPLNTKSYNRKSNIYEVFPYGIPYKNKLDVLFNVPNQDNLKHCAIYSYNDSKSKWNYLNSSIDYSQKTITAQLNKPAVLAVLEDQHPPWFLYTYPKNQQSIARDSINTITISIDDDLSGINSSEEHLQVFLDGRRIWVAYQPIDREISYKLPNKLSIGQHILKINISDRSGNFASKSIKFFIE